MNSLLISILQSVYVSMCTQLEVQPDRSSQTQQDLQAFLGRIVKSLGPSICRLATVYDWQSIYTADICCVCAVGGVMSHKELHYTCWTFSESQHHLSWHLSLRSVCRDGVNIPHGSLSITYAEAPRSTTEFTLCQILSAHFLTLVCQKLDSFSTYSEAQRRSQSPRFQCPFPYVTILLDLPTIPKHKRGFSSLFLLKQYSSRHEIRMNLKTFCRFEWFIGACYSKSNALIVYHHRLSGSFFSPLAPTFDHLSRPNSILHAISMNFHLELCCIMGECWLAKNCSVGSCLPWSVTHYGNFAVSRPGLCFTIRGAFNASYRLLWCAN